MYGNDVSNKQWLSLSLGLGMAQEVQQLPHNDCTTDEVAGNYPALSCIPIQVDIRWDTVGLSLQVDSKQLLQTLYQTQHCSTECGGRKMCLV